MTDDIFLARQPILDEDRNTFGYELLYRSQAGGEAAAFADPDAATRSVVERTLLDWGIEHVVGERFGFINAGPEIFSSGMYRALPAEGIVIEVRATAPVDDDMLDALVVARRDGYHIALDDVQSLAIVADSRLLEHASMVKVDISATPPNDIERILSIGLDANPHMKFIAERVETHAQFEESVTVGFELFQGYFFAKPQLMSRRSRPASAVSALSLLAQVQKPDIDIDEIEDVVSRDPTLAYRMLGVVNSCAFGLSRRVSSLRQAIVLLGLNQVRNLAMLLTLSVSESVNSELVTLGATRARMSRNLTSDPSMKDSAFTVGLLSVTDTMYGTAMEELLADLPVDREITEALTEGTGPLARTLALAIACERGDIDTLVEMAGSDVDVVLGHHAEAIAWADGFRAEVGEQKSKVRVEGLMPWPAPTSSAATTRRDLPVPTSV